MARHIDWDLDLAAFAFGSAAHVIKALQLAGHEEEQVFRHLNCLAATGPEREREILGTGAIELFNDDEAVQRLARSKLSGDAVKMLEDLRQFWGQPDYGDAP